MQQDGRVLLSNAVVSDRANTLYFEALAGAFTITSAQAISPLAIQNATTPEGIIGQPYTHTLTATGGVGPYTWSVIDGTLPDALLLAADGTIAGTPSAVGTYTFTVLLTDSEMPAQWATALCSIAIDPAFGASLSVQVLSVSSDSVIVNYGRAGLDTNLSCMLQVTDDPGLLHVLETYTDSGGAAWRQYLFGGSLTPGTTYYLQAVCGSETAAIQFMTAGGA